MTKSRNDIDIEINNELKQTDKEIVLEISKSYDNNRKEYLNEFKQTQSRLYKNALAYSNINTLMIFETLDAFPDSYAILLNKTMVKSRAKDRDIVLIDQIFDNYKGILLLKSDCIRKMKSEIAKSKSEFKIMDIFQNTGNKAQEERTKAELIDLLIWAAK